MPNNMPDTLFQLIRSLEKAEKRHFKLYITRSSAKDDLKVVRLFDAMDKLKDYDEKVILKKLAAVTKPQLSNLKAHLYKEVLASLRLLKTTDNIDLKLSEHLDNARVLYNKGLKHQSLHMLDKAKELARANHKFNFLVQVLSLEKKIETLHITRSSPERTQLLTQEALANSQHIDRVTRLSNLALLLYRWYVQNGHARNEEDVNEVTVFFKNSLLENESAIHGFYEKLYLYQSYCWYAFIRQDFLMYYRYSRKWIGVFDKRKGMIVIETGHYLKGMHNLLNAHFVLRNFKEFETTLKHFEAYAKTPTANRYDNFRTHTSIYINSAKINQFLMRGDFKEGLSIIPGVEEKLKEYALFTDSHRILVFNYKIASLHFGAGDYSKAIDYLHKIINDNQPNLRNDLQCYARLLHLLCHFEMGNEDILDPLIRSVWRFMARMKNLTIVEEEIFGFLRQTFNSRPKELKPALEKFLDKIKHLEKDHFETRSFVYLDIVSWVESKITQQPISRIINGKYLLSRHRQMRKRESVS